MNLIVAKRLLVRAAQLHESKTKALSKVEITNKINEIKYLADHKKASKQSIKHEIESLENRLEGVFDLQKNLTDERKKQSQKETLLKKRIAQLEHQLEIGKDKAIHKKVERLSNILAEHIVHKKIAQDIQQMRAVKNIPTHNQPNPHNQARKDQDRTKTLQNQVDKLKTQLESKKTSLDPISVQIIEEKIHLLEIKLGLHAKPHWINQSTSTPTSKTIEKIQHIEEEPPIQQSLLPQGNTSPTSEMSIASQKTNIPPPPQKTEVKHTVLLHTPPPSSPHYDLPPTLKERIINKSSPLPPPPKRSI